jgi:hypothetical protein
MSVTVTFGGDHPFTVNGIELSGYHRPLGGELANLSVAAKHADFFERWLACPPLGIECAVAYGGDPIMNGYLYGVRADSAKVELRIEG